MPIGNSFDDGCRCCAQPGCQGVAAAPRGCPASAAGAASLPQSLGTPPLTHGARPKSTSLLSACRISLQTQRQTRDWGKLVVKERWINLHVQQQLSTSWLHLNLIFWFKTASSYYTASRHVKLACESAWYLPLLLLLSPATATYKNSSGDGCINNASCCGRLHQL